MTIDPTVAIGSPVGEVEFSWNQSDVLLYHLGIGAGAISFIPYLGAAIGFIVGVGGITRRCA